MLRPGSAATQTGWTVGSVDASDTSELIRPNPCNLSEVTPNGAVKGTLRDPIEELAISSPSASSSRYGRNCEGRSVICTVCPAMRLSGSPVRGAVSAGTAPGTAPGVTCPTGIPAEIGGGPD